MKSRILLSIIGLWLSLVLVFNTSAVNPNAPGQLKKQDPTSGNLPPGQAKKQRKNHPPPVAPSPTPTLDGFGAVLSTATAENRKNWGVGRTQFQTAETPEDGLGPIFNNTNCFACHNQPDKNGLPIVGGASAQTEVRFKTSGGVFDLIHVSSIDPSVCQDAVPFDAVLTAHRKSNALFGIGFMEAIPDSTIIANQSRNNGKDGVRGRAAVLTDPVTTLIAGNGFFNGVPNRVGRFGWKNQEASLLAFAGDAQINELGETNRFFGTDFAPHQNGGEPPSQTALAQAEAFAGQSATALQDTPVDDTQPEGPANKDDSDRYTDFMQFNAKPPTVPLTASAARGQQVFTQINCTACHLPSMQTGPSKIDPALANQPVELYSDLLLHHMGTLGDGIVQAAAGADEFRTAPLWGLRGRTAFLHDGRAATILQAIQAHDATGAESQIIAQRFKKLKPADQQAILDFLNSI